ERHGGAVEAVPYMKAQLVESHRERVAKIERGEIKVVGQNSFTETEDSPLTAGADGGILTPDPEVERDCRDALERWKSERDQDADVVGLSILSGSHRELVPETVRLLREQGVDAPVVVGGIIPAVDASSLREAGVARVYTPRDFDLNRIMGEIADLLAEGNGV